MKHFTKAFIPAIAAIAGAAFSSCDEVKVEDRYIELPAVEAKRVVLLEEFTGQMCVNCPEAHEVIAGLLEQYPDNLISVSIHGGPDSNSMDEDKFPGIGLRNADGASYTDSYNVAAFPAGVVNRNTGVLTSASWAASIRAEMEKPTDVELTLTATASEDGKTVTIESEISPYDNISANYQLWVVESGIVSMQLTKSGMKADYVHNHVFRGVVNGHDGEAVHLVTREPQTLSHTVAVKDSWNVENLSIVGFIYNKDGVLQAYQAHVK